MRGLQSLLTSILITTSLATLTKVDSNKALFLEQGQLILTNTYSHLVLKYDISTLRTKANELRTIQESLGYIRVSDDWPKDWSPTQKKHLQQRIKFTQEFVNGSVEGATYRIENLLKSFEHDPLKKINLMERLQDHIERKTNTDHLISRQLYQHYLVKRQLFVIPLAGFAGFVGS